MTKTEAKALAVGTYVFWDQDNEDRGIVTEVAPTYINVRWFHNNTVGTLAVQDCESVHILVQDCL